MPIMLLLMMPQLLLSLPAYEIGVVLIDRDLIAGSKLCWQKV